uniref:Uncharacterized protein n=1 Tax=Kalanchoe fedtschenkoi TaxID=63787 RepID=A0A7N0TDQ7_KALFE
MWLKRLKLWLLLIYAEKKQKEFMEQIGGTQECLVFEIQSTAPKDYDLMLSLILYLQLLVSFFVYIRHFLSQL